MRTRFIEATNGHFWGKFLVGQFDEDEWGLKSATLVRPGQRKSRVEHGLLGAWCGWSKDHFLLLDLETGNGTIWLPFGLVPYDVEKREPGRVCPLYLSTLLWLYEWVERRGWFDLDALPAMLHMGGPGAVIRLSKEMLGAVPVPRE